jgi:hypothetical protein
LAISGRVNAVDKYLKGRFTMASDV